MRKLFLLRHAQSPSEFDMADKDRPLSDHGIKQAKTVAPHIQTIDQVLCSNAVRTKMTFQAMEETGFTSQNADFLDTLYNATAGDLLTEIQKATADNVLVIAHNPGIHMLAATLTGKGEPSKIEHLNMAYHPATLAILECPIESWTELQPQQNKLIDLIIPD